MTQHDLDLTITKISNRNRCAGGSWVQGKINDEYRFVCFGLRRTRRTRIVRIEPKQNFEALGSTPGRPQSDVQLRPGLDVPAVNTEVQVIVDFLCEGLSALVFGQ